MQFFRSRTTVSAVSLLMVQALVISTSPPPLAAQQDSGPPFHITVVEGEGAINNIRQVINRAASVLVEDENRNPLSGVSVTFFLPNEGPSGVFPNGSRVLTTFTDEKGIASSRSIRFNNLVGLMPIRVTASLFSQTTSATITQTNVSSAASVRSSYVPAAGAAKMGARPRSKGKIIAILVVAAAAGGAAYYFATKKSTPQATVTMGAPTVGGPQ
jgi:hypothetical protein